MTFNVQSVDIQAICDGLYASGHCISLFSLQCSGFLQMAEKFVMHSYDLL